MKPIKHTVYFIYLFIADHYIDKTKILNHVDVTHVTKCSLTPLSTKLIYIWTQFILNSNLITSQLVDKIVIKYSNFM